MSVLKVVNAAGGQFDSCRRQLKEKLSLEAVLLGDKKRLAGVRDIIEQVRLGGDEAVAKLTEKYDGVRLRPDEFRIAESQLVEAHKQLDKELLRALRDSIANVWHYQEAIAINMPKDWTNQGARLGVRYRPLGRVGICVPGASAALVSTLIMTVVPAKVARVNEVAVISSPSCNGSIHPTMLGLCYELDVKEVYRVSGAQAVAALALGTEHIRKVDKIVGPGNWWGQLAKKEVYGLVDIDSFAGPSEVLIIADNTAKAQWVAADMLSQAEHSPGSAVLLCDSEKFAVEVAEQVEIQLRQLSRGSEARKCVEEFCLAVVVKDMAEAVELANEYAAEHLQVQCANSDKVAEQIVNAGAIFIGQYSPVATGDYIAGPSHTLPTGGSARFFSGLNVNDFLKQSSIISYSKEGLKKAAKAISTIARAEGLDGHGRSVEIRVAK